MATGIINASSKYKDLISKSALIQKRSPAVYQLRPKKEYIGTLTKMTIGEKNVTKLNKTILLVGETGTGKSTLINALVNYAIGVRWKDDIWFQIVEEEKKSQSESQTSDVIVYQVFGFEGQTLPFSLTIIDTPGYGDTRGTEKDAIISERLLDLFRSEDGVHEINAVGLVMKASVNRLSDRLRYVFDSTVSLFGKNMERNIVALITHSDGVKPENALEALEAAEIKCARDEEENEPVHFLFNNHQTKERTKKNKVPLKSAWDLTAGQMSQFTEFLEKTEHQTLKTTVTVLNERVRLTACIQNLQERIDFIELKQTEIQQTQETLKKHEQEKKNNANFTVEVNETYKDKEDIDERRWWALWLNYGGAVTCNVCEENCHYPCTTAWYAKSCKVMKDGRCTSCTGQCPATDHVKEKKIYVTKTRKVKKTLKDIKAKYEKSKTESESKQNLLENLQRKMEELQRDKDQLLDEAFLHVVTLEKIALNVNSVSTYVHLDFLIEKMKERRDTVKVQKLEEMKRRVETDEGLGAAVRISNASSKYKDLISKSTLIQQRSPAVYQLKPKRENIGTLTKMTMGEKNVTKLNKTILLVGETGAGKSTLINALVNYAIGVRWEDDILFQIVDEETENQSESQTSDVIVYQIFGFEDQTLPFSLTIIDTPGYGSTRGIEHDVIISERLLDLFRSEDGVHEISAVGLVIKQSDNRLSDRLRYVFDSTMSLFGKNIEKCMVVLITHSGGKAPINALKALEAAKVKCARDAKNQPVHFLFDNCQTDDRTEDQETLKNLHKKTTDQMSQFTDFLRKNEPQPLVTTVDVLNNQVRLAACIRNLQGRIEFIDSQQKDIKQIQEALKKHEQEMKDNVNFSIEFDESYKEKESINGGSWGLVFFKGAVTCNVCKENCHHPGCTMAWYAKHCEVMKGGRCTSCTGKCPVTDHVKEDWIYVTKTRKVKKTLNDIKAKYDKSKTESESKLNLLEELQRETEKLTEEKDRWLDEAFQHVQTLEQIALNVNSVSTYVHLDFLIKEMKERGDTEKAKKLEERKCRVDENKGSKAIVRYMFGKLSAAWQSS